MSTVPTLSYEVTAHNVRPGRSEVSAKQATIAFDSSPRMGAELPGPAELLCSAFAACLLKNVERFSEMLPFSQQGASVHVTAEREQSRPGSPRSVMSCASSPTSRPSGSNTCTATSPSTAPSTTRSPRRARSPAGSSR